MEVHRNRVAFLHTFCRPHKPIGEGPTSLVFQQDPRNKASTGLVFKVERSFPSGSLKREWDNTSALLAAIKEYAVRDFSVQELKKFVSREYREWWWWNYPLFPQGTAHNDVLVSSLVPSFSADVQGKILRQVGAKEPSARKESIGRVHPLLSAPLAQNKKLGRRYLAPTDLHSIGLSPLSLAHALASFYALSLFAASLDPFGVTFTIVPSPEMEGTQSDSGGMPTQLLVMSLSHTSPFCLCSKGIAQAVRNFVEHDQTTRPTGICTVGLVVTMAKEVDEDEIWRVFKGRFVELGKEVLERRGLVRKVELVERFVEMVEEGAGKEPTTEKEERNPGSDDDEVEGECLGEVRKQRRRKEHMCPQQEEEREWDVVRERDVDRARQEEREGEETGGAYGSERLVDRTRRVVGDVFGMGMEFLKNLDMDQITPGGWR